MSTSKKTQKKTKVFNLTEPQSSYLNYTTYVEYKKDKVLAPGQCLKAAHFGLFWDRKCVDYKIVVPQLQLFPRGDYVNVMTKDGKLLPFSKLREIHNSVNSGVTPDEQTYQNYLSLRDRMLVSPNGVTKVKPGKWNCFPGTEDSDMSFSGMALRDALNFPDVRFTTNKVQPRFMVETNKDVGHPYYDPIKGKYVYLTEIKLPVFLFRSAEYYGIFQDGNHDYRFDILTGNKLGGGKIYIAPGNWNPTPISVEEQVTLSKLKSLGVKSVWASSAVTQTPKGAGYNYMDIDAMEAVQYLSNPQKESVQSYV